MKENLERITFALAGALIAGCITAYALLDESPVSIELSEKVLSESVDCTKGAQAASVVYYVKKRTIRGWLDIINLYTAMTLATEPFSGGSTYPYQIEDSDRSTKAIPDDGVLSANIVAKTSSPLPYKQLLYALGVYHRLSHALVTARCRGPGTAQVCTFGLVPLTLSSKVTERVADCFTNKVYRNHAEENT